MNALKICPGHQGGLSMLLDLDENDPRIFVTQSVHKQQPDFPQASQTHKKDRHIKGQPRYCNHARLNNAFMAQASTSPFYPLFASLDVNARIHSGRSGLRLGDDGAARCSSTSWRWKKASTACPASPLNFRAST